MMAKPKERDLMDSAQFYGQTGKTPADYMTDPDTGLRPGEDKKPHGTITVDLAMGISGRTIPPESVWDKGEWDSLTNEKGNASFYTWIVDGEGTPGNYEKRMYLCPEEVATEMQPRHPSKWTKKLREQGGKAPWKSLWDTGKGSSKSSGSSSSGLPWGLRIRCPGCGHFFKNSDLADHAQAGACAAVQAKPAMWVIECECHRGDLQAAATVLEGFPVKPPDMSGANNGEGVKPNEAGGSAELAGKAGETTG